MLHRIVALAAGVGLGACSVIGVRTGIEQPSYEVIGRPADGVEIRRYGARLAAETVVPGRDGSQARGEAFRILAGYIFGQNKGRAEVAMTAPVEIAAPGREVAMTAPVAVEAATSGLAMRFFMPVAYTRANLPEPTDRRVRIVDVPGQTVAALRYTGAPSAAAAAARARALLAALAGSGWRPIAAPVNLYYDPPWTVPFLRRNEVAVAVEPDVG